MAASPTSFGVTGAHPRIGTSRSGPGSLVAAAASCDAGWTGQLQIDRLVARSSTLRVFGKAGRVNPVDRGKPAQGHTLLTGPDCLDQHLSGQHPLQSRITYGDRPVNFGGDLRCFVQPTTPTSQQVLAGSTRGQRKPLDCYQLNNEWPAMLAAGHVPVGSGLLPAAPR